MTHRNEQGFTLAELLVVIAIMAVLIGVAAGSYAGLISSGTTESEELEKEVVQTAIDAYMAANKLTTLTPRVEGDAATITNSDPFAGYIRSLPTTYSYYWTSTGTATQVDPDGGGDAWSSWSKRAPITVTNSGDALTNYPVLISVTYDSDMQNDFDDLRFTNDDGSAEYSYWIECKSDGSSASVWVKIPSLASGDTIIYMRYGNADVSSTSDGDATFTFFDDFELYAEGSAIDGQGGWSISHTYTSSYARVDTIDGTKQLHMNRVASEAPVEVDHLANVTNSVVMRTRLKRITNGGAFAHFFSDGTYMDFDEPTNPNYDGQIKNGYLNSVGKWACGFPLLQKYVDGNGSYVAQNWVSVVNADTYYIIDSIWNGTSLKMLKDGAEIISGTDSTFSARTHLGLATGDMDNQSYAQEDAVDWVLLRKYTSSEPTYVIGAEE